MDYCKKCGNELRDNVKFCPSCGNPINPDDKDNISSNLDNNLSNKSVPNRKKRFKIAFICIIFVLLFLVSAGLAYMKLNTAHNNNMAKSIEILGIDIDKYPEVTVSIKVNNYGNKLNVKNVTVKENDAFQKELKLSDGVGENQYKISYKTSDESGKGAKNIVVACILDDQEYKAESSYNSPEKKETISSKSNGNNSVSTYDSNEIKVKDALESYENAYIRMINTKNIDYAKNSIDLSGGLISEFTTLIKNYSEQQITEDLISHNIEEIKKINDSEYEVTAYEKYYISYGKDKKSSYMDFRNTYVVKLTSSGFKVNSIKNVVTLSNKQNP